MSTCRCQSKNVAADIYGLGSQCRISKAAGSGTIGSEANCRCPGLCSDARGVESYDQTAVVRTTRGEQAEGTCCRAAAGSAGKARIQFFGKSIIRCAVGD